MTARPFDLPSFIPVEKGGRAFPQSGWLPPLIPNPNHHHYSPSTLSPMAPYLSHISSPERDAVDAIVSQAFDLCTLEEVAALNISHLSDSLLPTDLESRFRKLKSFPEANSQHQQQREPRIAPRHLDRGKEKMTRSLNRCESVPNPSIDSDKPEEKRPHEEAETSSPPLKPVIDKEPTTGLASSPSMSLDSSRESPSPPRRWCCFVLPPPKRAQRRKGKAVDRGRNDDILSDLGTFSMMEQQRKLKKALKEQEKASREAEKMVEWVKQASARMNVADIDELLSDDEEGLE